MLNICNDSEKVGKYCFYECYCLSLAFSDRIMGSFFLFDFAILLSNLEMPLSLFVVSFFIVHVCFTLLSLCCTLSLSV